MKRNWNIVREIMLEVEDQPAGMETFVDKMNVVQHYDRADVQHHANLLIEAGLLKGKAMPTIGGGLVVILQGLTWEGHDWLASIHSKTIFEKTLDFAKTKGVDLTLDMLKALAVKLTAAHLGLSP